MQKMGLTLAVTAAALFIAGCVSQSIDNDIDSQSVSSAQPAAPSLPIANSSYRDSKGFGNSCKAQFLHNNTNK